MAVLAAIVVAVGTVAGLGGEEPIDRVLAVVDGQVILQSDVRAFLELGLVDVPPGADRERVALTRLVERRLVIDQVNRTVVGEPATPLIDERVERLRGRLPDGTDLDGVLERSGLSPADLRHLLADELRREAYLAERFGRVDEAGRAEAVRAWVEGLVARARIRRSEPPPP